MAGSIQGLQASIGSMQLSGPTQEFQQFADAVNLDIAKTDDTFYMMEKAMEFAKNDSFKVPYRHKILSSLGISQSDIGALMSTNLTPDKVPKGIIRSEGHSKAFSNVTNQMQNFQDKIQIEFEKVAIKLMPALSVALKEVTPLLTTLGETVGLLTIEMLRGFALLKGNDWKDTWEGIKEIFSDTSGVKLLSGFGADIYHGMGNKDWVEKGLERARNSKTNKKPVDDRKVNITNNNTFNGVSTQNAKTIGKEAGNITNKTMRNLQGN